MLGGLAAQERNVQHRRVYSVKWGHLQDFVSTMKDLQALYKTAGVEAPMIVLQSQTGPDRIMVIRYYAKMSDALANRRDAFKGKHEAEYLALNNRLSNFVNDRESKVSVRDTELSLPRAGELPPYFRVVQTEVKPGKMSEYRALIKEFVNTGIKPAGIKAYTVLTTQIGGSPDEIVTGTGLQSLGELDDPPVIKAMGGQAKFDAFLAKRAALVNHTDVEMYFLRRDLTTWTNPK